MEYYRIQNIKSQESIKAIIKDGLKEPVLSDRVNCDKNHGSPFEFLCDVLLGRVTDFIVWACRSGSKSYLAGLITWIRSGFRDRNETTILGGSQEQSEKSYKAMNSFWEVTTLQDEWLASEPTIRKTVWRNGSMVNILTASDKSARGPHPQNLILDEVDVMDRHIFETALSQPQSKYGIPSSIGIFSTNHNVGGTMDYALQKAAEGGYKVYKWCIWECLESCKDYNCSTCPLSSICPGKHMKKANGYYPIEDFIKKMHQLSMTTLKSEWLCEKVGRENLVYGDVFDEDIHLVDRGFDRNKNVYVAVDFGGVNPFAISVYQNFDDIGWVMVDEVYMGNTTNPRFIAECKKREWWRHIEGVADPSRPDLIQEWRDASVVMNDANNKVDEGIEAVRDALAPVIGNPKLHFNKRCENLIKEFRSYTYSEGGRIIKENDHLLDTLRYFTLWKIRGKGREPRIRVLGGDD